MFAPITLQLAYTLCYFASKRSDLPDIPIPNAQNSELFPHIRVVWRNTFNLKSALILHKERFQNQEARAPILGPGKLFLSLSAESKWVIDQPEAVLSIDKHTEQNFQLYTTQVIKSKIRRMSNLLKEGLLARS